MIDYGCKELEDMSKSKPRTSNTKKQSTQPTLCICFEVVPHKESPIKGICIALLITLLYSISAICCVYAFKSATTHLLQEKQNGHTETSSNSVHI